MEYIIQILILFIFINVLIKLSFWKWWQSIIFGICCAAFVLFAYPYASMQSKTQLTAYMNNTQIMQDITVLITIESVLCFAFCFSALRQLYGRKIKKWVKPLYWYPSLLIFPVLFYALTSLIFSMSGTSFSTIAYIMAGAIFIIIPLFSYGIRWLLPEKELRLEVHFLVSLFVAAIGLITTVNGSVTYEPVKESLNIKALILSLCLFSSFFAVGYFWNKYKWKKRAMKNEKKKKIKDQQLPDSKALIS